MASLWQDLRYGCRALLKSPWFSIVAVATLGLGMAVNTTIFSVVNGLMLRPLPVPHPEQVVMLTMEMPGKASGYAFSYPDFLDVQKQSDAFSSVFAYRVSLGGITADGKGDHILYSRVSGNYFSALGVKPALGRLILPSEGQTADADPVVVLSYAYWQKRFGGDPNVIGKQVELNEHAATIVGITPREFHGTYYVLEMDAYVPIGAPFYADSSMNAQQTLSTRDSRTFTLMARLKPGVTLKQAKASLAVLAHRLADNYPKTDAGAALNAYPEKQARPDPDSDNSGELAAAAFMTLAGLLLLVACFNVANVLLVRATVRQREMAVRAALGAGRMRLVGQHLMESLLLAVAGGAVGTAIAWWASGFLATMNFGTEIPLRFDFTADWRVYVFAFAAICLTGVVVGVIPALRVARTDVSVVLHEGGRNASEGPRRHMARNTLVVAQVAGSLLLLVVAGLFVRSLGEAQHVNLGFDAGHVLNVTVSPDEAGYKEDRGREFYKELLPRVRALPGVVSAAEAFTVPMGLIGSENEVLIEEHPLAPGQQAPLIFNNLVSPGYFATMRIPLLEGRDFSDADDKSAAKVAIINRTMAEKFWPKEDAIGKQFMSKGQADNKAITVVGVVQTGKYKGIAEDPEPFYYVPFEQAYTGFRTIQVRTSVPPATLAEPIEALVREVGPSVPILRVQTMEDAMNNTNGFFLYRFGAQLTGTLGLLGLILALVGVYSVISYAAAQRTQEIGIRMALGAEKKDILRLVLGKGLGVVVTGIGLGLALAFLVTRAFKSMLLGVTATDPLTYSVVAVLLLLVGLFACWLPAHRATRISPLTALRHE
jgi:macrolide transport system ATP-binding/permease protein